MAGYSSKINDPAFKKYILNSNRWSAIFSFVLSVVAVIGFFIYGETSSEMENPQSLFIGITIGGMFISIALFQIVSRSKDSTWDGFVFDKKIEQKRKIQKTSNDDYCVEYLEYKVFIRDENDKIHTIVNEDDDTVYNYYKVGDRVRHHKGLNSYEKYDKSNDKIIFCNACGSLNDIQDDYCFSCKC